MSFSFKIKYINNVKAPVWEHVLLLNMFACIWVFGRKNSFTSPKGMFSLTRLNSIIDLLMIFTYIFSGSEIELQSFHYYLNSTNENIRLKIKYSKEKINYLDLTIYKDNASGLHTTLFRKEADRTSLLHYHSFHPSHLKTISLMDNSKGLDIFVTPTLILKIKQRVYLND